MDYAGPFDVKLKGSKTKAYVLLITDLYSWVATLVLSKDLMVDTFLRSLQIHNYSYVYLQYILSNASIQIIAEKNIRSIYKKLQIEEI